MTLTPVLVLATATPAQAPTETGVAGTAKQVRTVSWYEHRHTPDSETGYGTPAR